MVRVGDLVRPWSGTGLRHIPSGSPYGLLDFRFAGLATDNRWNDVGVAAVYLASDRAVAVAEFARHLADRPEPTRARLVRRTLYELDVHLDRLLDVRDPRLLRTIGLERTDQFLDRDLAAATARYLRELAGVEALLVPPIAFLDDPERWNAVLYLDRLGPDPSRFVTAVREVGSISVTDLGSG